MPSFPVVRTVALLAVFLCALNLRPALTGLAAVYLEVVADLGFSPLFAAALNGLPVFLLGAASLLGPLLAVRLNARRQLLTLVLLLAVLMALRPSMPAHAFLLMSVLACLAIGLLGALLPAVIRQLDATHPGALASAMTIGIIAGAALAPLAVVELRVLFGDFRPALALLFVPALIAALFWLPLVAQGGAELAIGQAMPLKQRRAWLVTAFMGAQSSLAFIVFIWLVTLLEDRAVPRETAVRLLSLSIGCQLIGALLLPWMLRRCSRLDHVGGGVAGLTLLGLSALLLGPADIAIPASVLLGLGQGGTLGVAYRMMVTGVGRDDVGPLSSMVHGFGLIGAGFGPLAVGLLRHTPAAGAAVPAIVVAISVVSIGAAMRCGEVSARAR